MQTKVFRSKEEWERIKLHYETANPVVPLRALARIYKMSESTIMKRAASDEWKHPSRQIAAARQILEAATDNALKVAAEDAAKTVAASVVEQMQPWIEAEKTAHVRAQVARAKRNLNRLDSYVAQDEQLGPKEEAHYAKAIETFDVITRRTLGMSESGLNAGSLSLRILTGDTAIELTSKAP